MSSVSFTVLCVCVFVQMKSAGAGDEGLFTESYCNICNAQLISESQRVAHYEVSTHTHRHTSDTHYVKSRPHQLIIRDVIIICNLNASLMYLSVAAFKVVMQCTFPQTHNPFISNPMIDH